MVDDVRMTLAVAKVLKVFVDEPFEPRHGYDLMKLTGYPSGKLYPILARLEAAGWLTKTREDVDPAKAGRPARYPYRISEHGLAVARRELAILHQELAPKPTYRGTLRPDGGRA